MSTRMKTWLTASEAAKEFQRSKRTIQLWIYNSRQVDVNPTLRIRTWQPRKGVKLYSSEDLARVARFKDAYRDTPTFGRT